MKESKLWFKGKIIPAEKGLVSVLSPGFQFGLNVFEGIRAYWNNRLNQLYLFRLEDHLNRLGQSCKLMRMRCPYSVEEMIIFIKETIKANDLRQDTSIRITTFVEDNWTWHASEPLGMFINAYENQRINTDEISGMRACVSSWERISDRSMPPRIKTGANYISGRYAHLEALANGYDLPIFLNSNGNVSEGAGSCLMILRGNELITPPLSASILESITRQTIIEFARDLNLKTIERDIPRTELYVADEIFLCGTSAEITPIISIDQIQINNSTPGKLTRLLLSNYHEITNGENQKYTKWITSVYK